MEPAPFHGSMQRVEELIAAIEQHANAVVRASAVEMVKTLLDVHRGGLEVILGRIAEQGEPGQVVISTLLQDELVSKLLLLHGLHPTDLETRIRKALDAVRPLLHARDAEVELEAASHDVIRLRVRGGGSTVEELLEQAILTEAPDVLRLEFVDADAMARVSLPLVREG